MIEKEIRILEIDKEKFIKEIVQKGAVKVSEETLQKRYVYDIDPNDKSKWMRLRTNGKKTTLTIKQILDKSSIAGTEEHEVEVSDFDETHALLSRLGYEHRNYQENKRSVYMLGDVEISIDTWPLIPTYAELEGPNEDEILKIIDSLKINESKITTLDVNSIYQEIYGIDMLKIKNLELGETYEGLLERNK